MAALGFDEAMMSEADRALYEAMRAKRAAAGAPLAGPYLALMNHPRLAERIEALGFYLKFEGRLPREVYQYAVLRVARACGVAFEWVDHVGHARDAGVPEPVIDGVRRGEARALPEPYATAEPVIAAALAWRDVPEACAGAGDRALRSRWAGRAGRANGLLSVFSAVNRASPCPCRRACDSHSHGLDAARRPVSDCSTNSADRVRNWLRTPDREWAERDRSAPVFRRRFVRLCAAAPGRPCFGMCLRAWPRPARRGAARHRFPCRRAVAR